MKIEAGPPVAEGQPRAVAVNGTFDLAGYAVVIAGKVTAVDCVGE